ncbi:solute carrier organic anion transporter family member 1C1-like isoform X2 [Osmerus eperlanus]
MGDPAEDRERLTSQQALCVPDQKTSKPACCSTLKMFIVALSFAYFSKALAGTYMKSSITQIERRFDLSSSLIGLIDGSFEMGNLLFLALVSHFGAKLHRPRLIGMGCFLMAVGSFLTGLPHFFMGRYNFDTVIQGSQNENISIAPCAPPMRQTSVVPEILMEPSSDSNTACVKDSSSHMWIYVFLGNALRGIGETPVTPLGISYVDDFAKAENSPFYIACLQTITLLGPMFGFLLGSYCARLYVDLGHVDIESVTITPKDARWVGAWWLGFFVSSIILLLASIPFWFLPRSLPKQGEENKLPSDAPEGVENGTNHNNMKMADIAKGFLPSLKRLLGTPAYFLLLCGSILKFNSFIGLLTFKAKYMEQQFGQSASRANFLIGVLNLPVVAIGIFLGGLLMKRYKLSVVSGAQLSFVTSFLAYLLLLLQFGTKCDNVPMAGLTVSYNGTPGLSYNDSELFSECNQGCSCSVREWDPVCAQNGLTYMSPCLAGCVASSGYGKNTVFHNCSCVSSWPPGGSASVSLGQCPRGRDCSRSFTSYMAVSVLSSFINSLGATPGYMVIIRCIKPELKSLALGIQTLVVRTLGGIPAPVYFGALIDSTCLKWGVKKCGGRGACRMYDSDMYRVIFLGLITCLSGSSYIFIIAVIILLRRQFRKEGVKLLEQPAPPNTGMELQTPTKLSEDRGQTPTEGRGELEGDGLRTNPQTEGQRPLPCHTGTEAEPFPSQTGTAADLPPPDTGEKEVVVEEGSQPEENQEAQVHCSPGGGGGQRGSHEQANGSVEGEGQTCPRETTTTTQEDQLSPRDRERTSQAATSGSVSLQILPS